MALKTPASTTRCDNPKCFSSGPMSPGSGPCWELLRRVLWDISKVPNPYTEEAHPNVSCSRVYRWRHSRHTWCNQAPFSRPLWQQNFTSHPAGWEGSLFWIPEYSSCSILCHFEHICICPAAGWYLQAHKLLSTLLITFLGHFTICISLTTFQKIGLKVPPWSSILSHSFL